MCYFLEIFNPREFRKVGSLICTNTFSFEPQENELFDSYELNYLIYLFSDGKGLSKDLHGPTESQQRRKYS